MAVTLLAYWPLLTADFTNWDDQETIAKNHWLNPPAIGHFAEFWNPRKPFMDIWIPMTYTVWSGLAALAYVPTLDPETHTSLNPWIFHGANVGVHLISVLLVYTILRRLTGRAWPAAAGAALFALHPVQVEPVGWLSGMKDLLCGCFSLVAINFYILYAESQHIAKSDTPALKQGSKAIWLYGAATAAFLLAMLSKPAGVVLPLVVGVLDLMLLRRQFKAAAIALFPWLVLSVLFAVEARFAQPAHHNGYITPLVYRPMIATDALAFYLYKLVFPARLGITYNRAPWVVLGRHWAYLTWVVPVVAGVGLWLGRRRFPWLVAAAGVSVAAVFSVLGLVPFDFQDFSTVADHYLYLAMLGPAIAIAFLLRDFHRREMLIVWAIVLAAFGTRTWVQCWTWKDSLALYSNAIAVNPYECTGYNNLASAYKAQNLNDKAIATFEEGLRHTPKCLVLHLNVAPLLANVGRLDEAEWHFRVIEPFAVGEMKQTIASGLAKVAQMRKEEQASRLKPQSRATSP